MKTIEELKDKLASIIVKEVFIAANSPRPVNMTSVQIIDGTRLIIPLAGTKQVFFGNGYNIVDFSLKKGQVLCIPPLCWDRPQWKSSHKMISVVFRPHCLRFVYIDYDEDTGQEYPEPDFFYHLFSGPSSAVYHAMLALTNANVQSNHKDLLALVTTSLIRLISNDLEQEKDVSMGKALAKYLDISEYIRSNLRASLTRQGIADTFKVTPQYISHLFKVFHGDSFSHFLTGCRINHATILLLQSDMTIDEIAIECNYNYTSHFIDMFKRQHGISPAKYRLSMRSR